MSIFPTEYTDKWSADSTDKVFSSDWSTNFNLTVSEIWDRNFSDRDTDNLTEWVTNLYYTDARVDANSTVVAKADKSNVIEKDSVTAFTPTLWTHPTNKDYVDNRGTNITWLTEDTTPDMDNDFNVEYDVSAWINKKYKMSSYRATDAESWEMTSSTKFIVPTQFAWETQIITRLLNIASSSVTYSHSLWRKPRKIRFSFDNVWGGTWAGIYLTNDDTNRVVWDDVSNSLCIDQSNVTGVVTSVTSTDYTISWVNTGSTSATMSILVDLE